MIRKVRHLVRIDEESDVRMTIETHLIATTEEPASRDCASAAEFGLGERANRGQRRQGPEVATTALSIHGLRAADAIYRRIPKPRLTADRTRRRGRCVNLELAAEGDRRQEARRRQADHQPPPASRRTVQASSDGVASLAKGEIKTRST